jgi:tripartite-type tricarboxylate transporter receptor subunit TctC
VAVSACKSLPEELEQDLVPVTSTAMEQGLAGFEVTSCCGRWVVPKGTSAGMFKRPHGLASKAFEDAEGLELCFKPGGAGQGGLPPEPFTEFVKRKVQKWGQAVRDARLTMEQPGLHQSCTKGRRAARFSTSS